MSTSKDLSKIFKKLSKIYRNPNDSGSLGGVARLALRAKELKITKDKQIIKEYLESERTYTLHKQLHKKFVRNRTVVAGIDSQWQADLADIQTLAEDNDGIKYILTVIDVFSKYAWAIPIKDKSAKTMMEAFKVLFEQAAPRKPRKFQTDKGTEFLNKNVQAMLKSDPYNIQQFTTMGDTKASIVERFNRTLKDRIWRYFTSSKTKRYIDVLQEILNSYNHSIHRSIKMRPADVRKCDEPVVWRRLYGNGARGIVKRADVLKNEDDVRIPKWKGDFGKGYEPKWTEEEFKVKEAVDIQQPLTVYKLVDQSGEEILGNFYKKQLQKIQPSEEYIVEKIVKKRTNPKSKINEVLVKWEGWPEKFNSWIPETNLT